MSKFLSSKESLAPADYIAKISFIMYMVFTLKGEIERLDLKFFQVCVPNHCTIFLKIVQCTMMWSLVSMPCCQNRRAQIAKKRAVKFGISYVLKPARYICSIACATLEQNTMGLKLILDFMGADKQLFQILKLFFTYKHHTETCNQQFLIKIY